MTRPHALTPNAPAHRCPRVAVIIPTYNGLGLLIACLDALRRQTYRDFAILVVDDGSTDGTAGALARDYPEVRVLRRARNDGLAVACNAGIAATGGELVCLLNNDTEAEPGWLAALVAALDAAPWAGSAASKLLLFEGSTTARPRSSARAPGQRSIAAPRSTRSPTARGARLTKTSSCTARMSI
jgi:GT2 family glycosyltransferase